MSKENTFRLNRIEGILEETTLSQKRTDKLLEEITSSQKAFHTSLNELKTSLKELSESQKKTDEQIRKTNEHVAGLAKSWGYLAADMAEEALIGAMDQYKIQLNDIRSRLKHKDGQGNILCEVDVVGTNGDVAVVVESKGRLTKNYVDAFISKLEQDVRKYFSECNRPKLYGVMAYLSTDNGIERYANRNGLFVIQALSGMGKIKNAKDFQPRSFI